MPTMQLTEKNRVTEKAFVCASANEEYSKAGALDKLSQIMMSMDQVKIPYIVVIKSIRCEKIKTALYRTTIVGEFHTP